MPHGPQVLSTIDRAAFAAALGRRLHRSGLTIELSRMESLIHALTTVQVFRRPDLYWAARVSLVRHSREIPAFDAVFAAVFDDAVLAMDPHARRTPVDASAPQGEWRALPGSPDHEPAAGAGHDLPWITRPAVRAEEDEPSQAEERLLADPLPSAVKGVYDVPFDQLDPEQLITLSRWLEAALMDWPSRRSRRNQTHPRGRRVDLRATLARSRSTGFEPVRLAGVRPVRKRRPLVMLCDVSRSMQAYTQVYVHLMRAAALTARAETFAFSTGITRLTPALQARAHAGPSAIELAAQRVAGHSPGTRIGHSLRQFLASRQSGSARGAIVIIASDGWDADDPAELEAAMIRLHRRARHVIWLNPRASASSFAPLTGAMAAALPYCDQLLPGHTMRAMQTVVSAISAVR